jgi:hypothetical protein
MFLAIGFDILFVGQDLGCMKGKQKINFIRRTKVKITAK